VREIEKTGTYRFALRAARYAFERLTHMTNTAVTVAVYDTAKIIPYIAAVEALCQPEEWEDTVKATSEKIGESACPAREEGKGITVNTKKMDSVPEYYDCAENPGYREEVMEKGVTVFYRPPLFGRGKGKTKHSGWECNRASEAAN